MAMTYHATVGGVLVKTGTGAAHALEQFCIPEEGVDIAITIYDTPIHTDVSGQKVPAELQDFGKDAVIKMRAISWDDAVFVKLATAAAEAAELTEPAMGGLIGTGGYSYRLLILSSTDLSYNFINAKLRPIKTKPSSVRNFLDLEFYAWAYLGPTITSAATVKLFDRTTT
jgi:hypothetical protein